MPDFPYDPFICAAPGHYHGDIGHQLSGSHPGRSLEIHLKNQAPTVKFDPATERMASTPRPVTHTTTPATVYLGRLKSPPTGTHSQYPAEFTSTKGDAR